MASDWAKQMALAAAGAAQAMGDMGAIMAGMGEALQGAVMETESAEYRQARSWLHALYKSLFTQPTGSALEQAYHNIMNIEMDIPPHWVQSIRKDAAPESVNKYLLWKAQHGKLLHLNDELHQLMKIHATLSQGKVEWFTSLQRIAQKESEIATVKAGSIVEPLPAPLLTHKHLGVDLGPSAQVWHETGLTQAEGITITTNTTNGTVAAAGGTFIGFSHDGKAVYNTTTGSAGVSIGPDGKMHAHSPQAEPPEPEPVEVEVKRKRGRGVGWMEID